MKFNDYPLYINLFTAGSHRIVFKQNVNNNYEGDFYGQYHKIKESGDIELEQLMENNKVFVLRKMDGDDKNGNFFVFLEPQFLVFSYCRINYLQTGKIPYVRDIDLTPRMKKLVMYKGGFEESIDMTRYFKYPLDIDCKNVKETVEVFNVISKGIKERHPDDIDRYFRGRHKGHMNPNECNAYHDYEPVYVDKSLDLGNEADDIYSMTLSIVKAVKDTAKTFSDHYVNMGVSTSADSFVIRASMFDKDGKFIKNSKKYSFHMIFKNIIFNVHTIAATFTQMVIANLIAMYIKGANYRPIEFHKDDMLNSFENLWTFTCGRLEYDANTRATIQDFREFSEGEYLKYKKAAQTIYDVFDLGLYSLRHNLRLMYEPKGTDERYSIPITKSHSSLSENPFDSSSSTIVTSEAAFYQEYRYIYLRSEDNQDTEDKYYRSGTCIDKIKDTFLKKMSTKVIEEFPQFDIRGGQINDGKIGMILFNRLRADPTPCPFCNRRHDKDNTLYLSIIYDDNNDRSAFLRCRHADKNPQKGINNYRLMGTEKKRENTVAKLSGTINKSTQMPHYSAFYTDSEYISLQTETNFYEIEESLLRRSEINFEDPDVIYIHSGMGTGKTKVLMKHICSVLEDTEETERFVSVSFRQTQANDMENKYNKVLEKAKLLDRDNRFWNYQTCADFSHHRNFIVQVESLPKIDLRSMAKTKYTLILDEIISIFQQFDSESCRRENKGQQEVFFWLIKYAHKIIVMDAHMTIGPYELIKSIRNSRRDDDGNEVKDTVSYYYNKCLTHKDYKYLMIDDKHEWLTQLAYCVSKGKRCVIATSSKKKAGEIYTFINISGILPEGKTVKLYTSETDKTEKTRDFSNVNKYWKDIDILIYSPTAGAGISFECRGFDTLFGYFVSKSCTAEADIQLLGRVRDFSERTVYIYTTDLEYSLPTTKDQLYEYSSNSLYTLANVSRNKTLGGRHELGRTLMSHLEMSIDANGTWRPSQIDSPKNILEIHIELNKNRSSASILRRLVILLCTMSHNVEYHEVNDTYKRYCFKEYENTYKEIRSKDIAKADCINEAEYHELVELTKKGGTTTVQDQLAIKKYQMANTFNISSDKLNDHNYVIDYLDEQEEYFNKLSMLYNCKDIENSHERLLVARIQDSILKVMKNDPYNKSIIDRADFKSLQLLCEILLLLGIKDVTLDQIMYYNESYVPKDIDPEVSYSPSYTKYIYDILDKIEMLKSIVDNVQLTRSINAVRKAYEKRDATATSKNMSKLLTLIFDRLLGIQFLLNGVNMYFYRNNMFEYQEGPSDREPGIRKPKVMPSRRMLRMYNNGDAEGIDEDGIDNDSDNDSGIEERIDYSASH